MGDLGHCGGARLLGSCAQRCATASATATSKSLEKGLQAAAGTLARMALHVLWVLLCFALKLQTTLRDGHLPDLWLRGSAGGPLPRLPGDRSLLAQARQSLSTAQGGRRVQQDGRAAATGGVRHCEGLLKRV